MTMQERLIHRDVKPENMLIGRRNEIVLSDFGIAAIAHSTSSMTAQASIGTVPYMAPEQIQEHPRAASDQYALGIVIYEWLTGELPFNGSFTEIFAKHLMTPPPPLRQKVPALSAEVEQVVLIALAKDPRQRFGSIQAFATALEKASQTTQQPAGAAFAETVLSERSSPQSSSPLPPTVLAAPAIATPTDLKTPTGQTLEPTVAASPPMHTPPIDHGYPSNYSRTTIHAILRWFAEEQFAGMPDKSHARKQPRKVGISTIQEIKKLSENPDIGAYRVSAALEQMGIKLSRATCGRYLSINRKLYHLQVPRKPRPKADMPFRAERRHQFWSVDVRYLDMHRLQRRAQKLS
jgi:serine/threonine protein kinase